MEVGVVFYSEGKIALELNLKEGNLIIPKIKVKDIKEIKNKINERWNIECDDYFNLLEDKIKYIIIGSWENRLKSLHGFKTIWFSINKAIDKTKKKDKRTLTFLKENYREVILPSHEKVGIAKKEECLKYNLITRAFVVLKEDYILTSNSNKEYKTHLFELKLGEEITNKEIQPFKKVIINIPKKYSLTLIDLKKEQSLTFLEEKIKNINFKPLNQVNCPIAEQIKNKILI